jgi:Ca2+/H+ antiporter
MIRDGVSRRWEGALLLVVYLAVAVGFLVAGNR